MAVLAIVLASLGVQAGPTSMGDLIARLSADDLETRERAQGEIQDRWKTWTETDVALLEKAAASKNAEAALRTRAAFERVSFFRTIPEETWLLIPDLGTVFIKNDLQEVLELLQKLWTRTGELRVSVWGAVPVLIQFMEDRRRPEAPSNSLVHMFSVMELARPKLDHLVPAISEMKSREEARAWWKRHGDEPEREWHLPLLTSLNERTRAIAVSRLVALKDASLNERLLGTLKSFTDEKCCVEAMWTFWVQPDGTNAEGLKPFLADPRPRVRFEAARRVHRALPKESIDAVIEILEHPERMAYPVVNGEFRPVDVFHWLAQTNDERGLSFIFRSVGSGSVHAKFDAISTVAQQREPRADEALVRAFDDPERLIRDVISFGSPPRVCDWAAQKMMNRIRMFTPLQWNGSHRDRDANLALVFNQWRKSQGLPAIPFLGPGIAAVTPEQLEAVIPDLIHADAARRSAGVRKLSELGAGAWMPLQEKIAKLGPAEKGRLEEASRGFSNTLRKVWVKNEAAAPFAERLRKRLHEPFDVDGFLKEIAETWFDDPAWRKLTIAVSRGQDGRGVSIDVEAERGARTDWNQMSLHCSAWTGEGPQDRRTFEARLKDEFKKLKESMDPALDRHAESQVRAEKLRKD